MDAPTAARELLRDAQELVDDVVRETKRFAASEQGRTIRRVAATALIVAAPAVASMPAVRRTIVGKLFGLAGGAALLVSVAEKVRDWEPDEATA